jgi:hypothetical protein
MLMRGKHDIPMHQHPFTLVRVTRYNEAGNPAFNRPLWLVVLGERRGELSLEQIYLAYPARFDIEHFFSLWQAEVTIDPVSNARSGAGRNVVVAQSPGLCPTVAGPPPDRGLAAPVGT